MLIIILTRILIFLIYNNDPQLVALIFSLISITHNKDDLSNYIKKRRFV